MLHRASILAALLFTACRTPAPALTVLTDHGPLTGTSSASVRAFLGVPYAAPPIGELRWKPPQELAAWTSPRDATRTGPPCAQPETPEARPASSEDCLTLNVWSPANDEERRPVLVWIHGGAFYSGSGSDRIYDGARLARRTGAVVVTMNYRLGPFGFFAHRELARELGREVSPAHGILDQRAALRWVQKNVAAFGGDPKRVTIFGESAGGWSVCIHLVAPNSRGLFSRAIIQSGACSNTLYFGAEEALAQGDLLARTVGCETLDCLRKKDAAALSTALPMKRGFLLSPGIWWGPIVDGVELPRLPLDMIGAGDFAKVPLLIGMNRDEGILHTMTFKEVSPDEVAELVRAAFGEQVIEPARTRYADRSGKDALTDIVTDGVFVCEARRISRAVASFGVPVYLYHFTQALDDPRVHHLGATHSVDLFFLFGNRDMGYGISPGEQPLSLAMMDAWGRFARDGDPGGAWPRYDRESDLHRVLNLQISTGAKLKSELCDLWDMWLASPVIDR